MRIHSLITAAALLVQAPALAESSAHHFPEVPLSGLSLSDTVTPRKGVPSGIVEDKAGNTAIVREGDLLGKEGLRVLHISRGCVSLIPAEGEAAVLLCMDEGSTPRS